MENFVRFRQFWFYVKNLNLNEILNISGKIGNTESTKKADHILEMPGLGES